MPTEQQLKNRETALSNLSQGKSQNEGVITSSDLQNDIEPLKMPPIQTEDMRSVSAGIPSFEDITRSMRSRLPQEKTQTDLQTQILDITGQLSGKSEATLRAEQEAGIPQMEKDLQDTLNQLQTLEKQAQAIPIEVQQEFAGRGVTAAGVEPIETSRLRNNAIQRLGLSAVAQTRLGNLQTARANVDRMIELEFAPLERNLQILDRLYQFNRDSLERADKKRAEQLAFTLQERNRVIQEQKEERNLIAQNGLALAQMGLPNNVLQKAFSAQTYEQSLGILLPHIAEQARNEQLSTQEQLKYQRMKDAIDIQSKQIDMKKKLFDMDMDYQKFIRESQERGEAEALKSLELANKNQEDIYSTDAKIGLINSLLSSAGFNSAVGATALGRVAILDKFGAKANFIAGVEQLVSQEFLSSLISVKSKGGTFGALTEKEQLALTSAATKIGTWRVCDTPNGACTEGSRVVGYNIDETSFTNELNTIRGVAERAKLKALGQGFDEKENTFLTDVFTPQPTFDPASVYSTPSSNF